MGKILTFAALLLALLLAILVAWPRDPSPAQQYLDFQEAQIKAAQEQADATRWRAFWDVALPVGGTLALATVTGLLVMGFIALWERRRPLVNVGTLPVDRRALHQGVYDPLLYGIATGQALAAVEAARRGSTPAHLTYSPHETPLARLDQANARQTTQALPTPFAVPTLGQAIEQGLFKRGQYLQGFTLAGQPLYLAPDVGRSLLAAGQGGSGKSTLVAGAALQELIIPLSALGVPGLAEPPRYYIIDPAAKRPQALMQRLRGLEDRVVGIACTPNEVQQICRAFLAEGRQRIDAGITDGHRFPFVLLADEVSMIYDDPEFEDVLPDLNNAFLRANTQFRAIGGKATAGVHLLPAHAFGGKSTIRRSFSARAAGRLDPGDGEIMGLKPSTARNLPTLAPGHFILTAPGMVPTEGIALNVASGDVERALDAAGLNQRARTVHPMPDGSQGSYPEATGSPMEATEASAPDPVKSAIFEELGSQEASDQASDMEAERAYTLFMEGHDMHKIVQALRGQDTNGRRGQVANHEIQQMIRDEIARQAG